MATYSITMMTPETRIYLEPPFRKPVQYIELLECHALSECRTLSEWITFNESQLIAILDDKNVGYSVEILSGSYTLRSLQNIFNKNSVKTGITIKNEGGVFSIYSNKYENAGLSK